MRILLTIIIIASMMFVGCTSDSDVNMQSKSTQKEDMKSLNSVLHDSDKKTSGTITFVKENDDEEKGIGLDEAIGGVIEDSICQTDEIKDTEIPQEIKDHFVINYIETDEDKEMEVALYRAYERYVELFELTHEGIITINIYKDQPTFWQNTFNGDNNHATTGFANVSECKIHLTSPKDTSIKSRERMLKVPAHELVHILLPHDYIEIREGVAVYLADQIRDYNIKDIPAILEGIITYRGTVDEIGNSYNMAGLKTKYIIEECLESDHLKYLEYMEDYNNYALLGFDRKEDFLEELRQYLIDNALDVHRN